MVGRIDSVSRRDLVRATGLISLGLLAACAPATPPAPVAAPTREPPVAPPPTAPAAAKPTAAPPSAKPSSAAAPTQAPPKPRTLTKLKLSLIAGTLRTAFTQIGLTRGFYADEGLDLEIIGVQDGAAQLRGLLSGEFDSGEMGGPGIFAAISQGAPLKLVASHKGGLNQVLYASKEITKLEDLYGKTIGIAGLNQAQHQLIIALFDVKGLDLSKVEFANIGSSPAIFKAVLAGKVDAGASGSDFIPTAEKDPNVHVLASFAKELPLYIQTALVAKDKDIAERPELVMALMAGIAKSLRYCLDNPNQLVDFAVKDFGKTEDEAAFGLRWERENRALNPNLDFTREQVDFVQRINVRTQQQKESLPFERVANPDLAQKVVARIGRYEWR